LRGNAYANIGMYEEAVNDFTMAISINSNNARTFYNRGRAYLNMKEYHSADKDFKKVKDLIQPGE
ncbi:MAG: tetratricopeptide repeat protein, partial [Actinomycetia bacterium]|nr:tetratricopeptide repeat protein [Actinomycetes bacterium]